MSPRHCSTSFGEPLSIESKKLVNEVRERLTETIDPKFNTDFNIYRFVMNAERVMKNSKDVVESAAKALNQHLCVRRCLRLDELPDISFEENRLFTERFLPRGEICDATDSANRLLWFIEYATISVESIAQSLRSSESIRWQFRQFEHMLRRVNRQESETGRLSSLRHIIDMNGYEINPFTMLFVSSGTLSYYSQLFHYDNYPELVNPIELVNIAKWIHVPYRIIKAMMPAGFSDRFRLHDGNFLANISAEININDIPTSLGGRNERIKCIPSDKNARNWTPGDEAVVRALETLHVPARKFRYFRVVFDRADQLLSWYFRTDGDIYLGVFYEPLPNSIDDEAQKAGMITNGCPHKRHHSHHHQQEHLDLEAKEVVHPWFKFTARLVHESDALLCHTPGVYYVVFSNKQCWLHSRSIDLIVSSRDPLAGPERWRHRPAENAAAPERCDLQFAALANVEAEARPWRSMSDPVNPLTKQ